MHPGTRFGAYEIVSPLGAGGMGEVYRARDTKLGREVAVKVLPEALAGDPDRVQRFEREAKVLASLNHPHIAQLYGMEQSAAGDGGAARHFLVMELVEGETLHDRLQRGALPVEEALAIAIQIADALETAHEQGIVHRDLKPANVKLRGAGGNVDAPLVKVLDFGLAKALDPPGAASGASGAAVTNSPTLSVLATQAGLILGTAAYMSPEQAKGAPTDRRSDVFSFGVVLYEMLTGRQPFLGETAAEIMASVMIRDADLAALPSALDPRLAELIKRCLDKNPRKRWQAMGDLRVEVEAIAAAPRRAAEAAPLVAGALPRALWRRAIPIAAAVVITAIVTAVATRWATPVPSPTVTRFPVPAPTFKSISNQTIAFSPDETHLVFVADKQPGRSELMIRAVGELNARSIPGTEVPGNITALAFSPDGRSIAFFANRDSAIQVVPLAGGPPRTVCKAELAPNGISWSEGRILFPQPTGIYQVSEQGGVPELIVKLEPGEVASWPELVGRSGSVLFSVRTTDQGVGPEGWDKAQVIVQAPGGVRHLVASGGSYPRYLTSGHIVYAQGGTLLAVLFDVERHRVLGPPTPVLEGVSRSATNTNAPHYGLSATGSLAYVPGAAEFARVRTMALLDLGGRAEPLPAPPDSYVHPRVSPDGRQVAFATGAGGVLYAGETIWIYDLGGKTPARRLTFGGQYSAPIWTRDGQSVVYAGERGSDRGLFMQRADGTGGVEQLTRAEPGTMHYPESWAPGDRTLSFRVLANGNSIWTVARDGDRVPKPLVQIQGRSVVTSEFSPDGRWLAYGSNELGTTAYQVFVQPYPPTGAKYQVNPRTSSSPIWSRDGKRLFFAFAAQVFAVDVQTAPTFVAGQPADFDTDGVFPSQAFWRNFDLMPDGKRLLVLLPHDPTGGAARQAPEINVVLNWVEELKAKVPVP
jgi:serine/threonine-protein kinase